MNAYDYDDLAVCLKIVLEALVDGNLEQNKEQIFIKLGSSNLRLPEASPHKKIISSLTDFVANY